MDPEQSVCGACTESTAISHLIFFSILGPNNDEPEGSRKSIVIKIEFLTRASHHLSAWGASTWTPGSLDPPRTPSAAVWAWLPFYHNDPGASWVVPGTEGANGAEIFEGLLRRCWFLSISNSFRTSWFFRSPEGYFDLCKVPKDPKHFFWGLL